MSSTKLICLVLFTTALSSCGTLIKLPNTKACSVAGLITAGADCAWTNDPKTEEMTFEQFMDFLTPNATRGGAICQSADDWTKMTTALEQACRKLGKYCTKELKNSLNLLRAQLRGISQPTKLGRAARANTADDSFWVEPDADY